MSNLLENLNKEQLAAVTHKEGPLLIVAGAGTGKTKVVTERLAYLIETSQANLEEILALTFTEKAAEEMEERVGRLLPFGYLDLWISTFHSFAERILGEHGLAIGLSNRFKLLNEFQQWSLIKKNLDKFNLDYYRPLGSPDKFISALVKHFSRLKDEDISPADYIKYASELEQDSDSMLSGGRNSKLKIQSSKYFKNQKSKAKNKKIFNLSNFDESAWQKSGGDNNKTEQQEVARIIELANAYHVYQQLLLDSNALDFGDLINYCLKLFRERPTILEKYRQQFKYILIDEFQDTNWAQYELIKLLAAPRNNIVVVGDDDQSIYKFRGASLSNILQFKKDFPRTKEIFLVKNYRNKQNILDLSYNFIKLNNPNRLEYQLNKISRDHGSSKGQRRLLNKKLVAQEKGNGIINVISSQDLESEVNQVINKIIELKRKEKSTSWDDFAILVRANDSAKIFCNNLEQANLPYQFLAFRGLYAKSIVMDIIAYFKLLDNYHESVAMYRILCLPFFNFSFSELINLNHLATKKTLSLYEVLLNLPAFISNLDIQAKAIKFISLINKHTALTREKSASEIMLDFLNDSGYLKYLSTLNEASQTELYSYLNQFLKRIKVFEEGSDDKSVKAFLNELNMEIDAGEEGALSPDLEAGPEAIKIMTVHSAKGLEFKYVFIVNLVDKRFPTIERHEPINIPDPLVKEILPEGNIHLEEERRLFYVAMTRAKDGLYFSWAKDYGGLRKKKPSRFLIECELVKEEKFVKEIGNKVKKQKNNILTSFDYLKSTQKGRNFNLRPHNEKNILPPYFSYTQLAAFSSCPYQYRFAHILKIPVFGKPFFSFGKTLHKTMQQLFSLLNEKRGSKQKDLFGEKSNQNNSRLIDFSDIIKIYEAVWQDEWYQTKMQKEEYKSKGREILKGFFEKHKDNWPKVLFIEKGFNIKIRNDNQIYIIRGIIDRIDEVEGKIKIIDYKTGRAKEKLSFEEKEQLLIYQLAGQSLFKEKIHSLAFYYLDNNSEFEFSGTQEELKEISHKIITTIEEIKKGEFPPKPSQLCRYCDFKDICEFRQN